MQHIIFAYQYITAWWNSLGATSIEEKIDEEVDNGIFDTMYDYK